MFSQKEEESAAFQSCYSFELQEEVKKLKEQLRESKAEIRQLKAELGRYLFLEDKEKRSGKLQLLPRAPTSDESGQYAASLSCNETGLDGRLLVEGAFLKRQPGPSLRTIYIEISNSLSAEEFQHMKELAKGKVNGIKLARMTVAYELLDELERVSDHPCTDIGKLLESIHRLDLLEKLGVSLHEGIAAVSQASLPLKDESLDLLSAKDDKRKIVTRRSRVSAGSSALSGEVDGGRISRSQEDTSSASFSSFESSAENEREIPASRDTEDYKGLPLESVRNDGKKDTRVLFSSDQVGPSSILSSTRSNSSDSLVLNSAEGVQATCLRSGSPGSCEEPGPTEMFLATGSGFSGGMTSGKTSLNIESFEEEIPQEAHFSDSEDNVTVVGGNNETIVDNMQGTSVESCNGETSSSLSGPRASPALAESDSGISSSSNSAHRCLLTGHEEVIVADRNQLTLQHNSIEDDQRIVGRDECNPDCSSKTGNELLLQRNSNKHDQRTEGRREPGSESSSKTRNELLHQRNSNEHDQQKEKSLEPGYDRSSKTGNQPPPQQNSSEPDQLTEVSCEPDAANSFARNWERQGARPKRTQTQRPVDPPLWPSSSPVSDGLAKDFLARHSQDRAVRESLFTDDRYLTYLGPESLRDTSIVDGLTSASEAYSARPYFGTTGAYPCVRLGGAFSDVPSGGSAVRAGLLSGGPNNESSYSSSTHATAVPLPSFTGQTDFSSVWNGMSSDGDSTSNRFLLPNAFANSDHSLTGEQDFSRDDDSLLDHNLLVGQQSLQQLSTPISLLPNSRFVYGSTNSDFAFGAWYGAADIHPGYSVHDAQGHVLSEGNSNLIDDQNLHNGNLNLESQSSRFGDREQVPGSFAASGVLVGSRDFPLSCTVSSSSFSCTMVVSHLICRPSVGAASNVTSTLVNTNKRSVFAPTVADDDNEEASLLPVSGEVNSKDTSSTIHNGRNTVEPNDNSLAVSERRMAEDAVERMLRVREEREEFMRELQRKEQMVREERERERREKEDRECEEAERWPPQQEGVSTGSRWLCEHYQRRCRVRFPCCTQFYPCDRCHNSSSNCKNDEAKACHATHLNCSLCQFEQEIDENSDVCRGCGEKMAAYFCSICKHFTSVDKNPYHCDQCGICRIHKDNSFHCKVCNVCFDRGLENNHKCRPDSGHDDCCICLEDTFSGCETMRCSHKVHRECAIAMIQSGIRTCPVCRHPL